MPYNPDVEAAAIALVKGEVSAYENPHYRITEDISFDIFNLIRQCRKNYHGVFDKPKDATTGRDKIHPRLTMAVVEGVVKSIDMDMKHWSWRSAVGRKGIPTAQILRLASHKHMKNTFFGEMLDENERTMCIDGTAITKSWIKTVNGKEKLVTVPVDRLNFYIDPTARSIADAHRVTERAVKTVSQVKSMDWENTNDLEGNSNLNSNPVEGSEQKTSKDVDVYETWGQIPEWIVKNDPSLMASGKEIEAQIVTSGIKSDHPRLHLIEENKKKDREGNPIRPYVEMRYRKIQGRWDGLGVAEQIWTLEMWKALTINTRINRNTLAQLGIFTVKKDRGIAPNALSRIASNGVIRVRDHDDIAQLPIAEAGAGSYKDEEVIEDLAQKLTGAFEVAVGDALPASTTATNGAIMDKNASKTWKVVRDQIGYWGTKWSDWHLKPYIGNQIKKGEILSVTGDMAEFDKMRKQAVAYLVDKKMEELFEQKKFPTAEAVQRAFASAEERIMQDGSLFFEVMGDIILDGVDAEVQITNEDLNVGVLMNNIIQLMQIDQEATPYYREVIADLMGIPRPTVQPRQQQTPLPNNIGFQTQQPNEVDEVTKANTLPG